MNPDAENVSAKVVHAPLAMAAAMPRIHHVSRNHSLMDRVAQLTFPQCTVHGAATSADLVVFVRDRLASRHVFRIGPQRWHDMAVPTGRRLSTIAFNASSLHFITIFIRTSKLYKHK